MSKDNKGFSTAAEYHWLYPFWSQRQAFSFHHREQAGSFRSPLLCHPDGKKKKELNSKSFEWPIISILICKTQQNGRKCHVLMSAHQNVLVECFAVVFLVLILDPLHIDLRTTHHDASQDVFAGALSLMEEEQNKELGNVLLASVE